MDENMRKQQEFMLASQKMQVRISDVLRSCIYPPLPPVLSLSIRQMERQMTMQIQMRNKMLAQQLSMAREAFNW